MKTETQEEIRQEEIRQIELRARELFYFISHLRLKEEEQKMLLKLIVRYAESNKDEVLGE